MPDLVLRHTTINALLRCPHFFELVYVRRVEILVKPVLFLGGTVHVALAEGYRRKIAGVLTSVEELADLFSAAWDREAHLEDEEHPREIDWREEDRGELKDTGIALVRTYWRDIQPKVEPMEVEMSLKRDLDGITLTGRVDLLTKSGELIDHKTGARAPSEDEILRNLQPTIYSLLLGGPTKGAYHYLLKQKAPRCLVVPFERSQEEISWFRERVLPGVVGMIRSGSFPANPTSWLCSPKTCDVWYTCRGLR